MICSLAGYDRSLSIVH